MEVTGIDKKLYTVVIVYIADIAACCIASYYTMHVDLHLNTRVNWRVLSISDADSTLSVRESATAV